MTREEAQAWVASLKPGDVVIHKQWNNYLSKLTVTKVTPSGIIRTDKDVSFKLSSWSNLVRERGSGISEIVPATDDLLQEVERQDEQRWEEMDRKRTIRWAVSEMSCANTENVPYEFAVDFLALLKQHGIRFER